MLKYLIAVDRSGDGRRRRAGRDRLGHPEGLEPRTVLAAEGSFAPGHVFGIDTINGQVVSPNPSPVINVAAGQTSAAISLQGYLLGPGRVPFPPPHSTDLRAQLGSATPVLATSAGFTLGGTLGLGVSPSLSFTVYRNLGQPSQVVAPVIGLDIQVRVNAAPSPVVDAYSVVEDANAPLVRNVLTNDADGDGAGDADGDGENLQVVSWTNPARAASFSLNASGELSYRPEANFSGPDSFTYTVSDGYATATVGVTIDVTPVNDPPLAVDDPTPGGAYPVNEGATLTVAARGVLLNDSDVDNAAGSLTAELVQGPAASAGTLQLGTDGSFQFTPTPGFGGVATFTYRAIDPLGAPSNVATVRLNVSARPSILGIVSDVGAVVVGVGSSTTRDPTPRIFGTATPGRLVTVRRVDTDAVVGTVVASAVDGTWALDVPTGTPFAPDSINPLVATTPNAQRDGTLTGDPFTVRVDSTPPSKLDPADLDPGSDTGSSDSDNVTLATTLRFLVTPAEAGGLLQLLRDGRLVATLVPGSTAPTTIDDPGPLPDGLFSYRVRQVDPVGNPGVDSDALVVTVGTVPPNATTVPDLRAESDTGASPSDNLTNVASPVFEVSGVAPGSTLDLFRDGQIVRTLASPAGGTVAIADPGPVPEGPRDYRVRQTDLAGNVGPPSGTLAVGFDRTAPRLSNGLDIAPDPRREPVTSIDLTFSEPIDPNSFGPSALTLTRDGVPVPLDTPPTIALVAGTTSTYRIGRLGGATSAEGTYTIVARAGTFRDVAGNAGTGSVSDSWVMDTTAPRVLDAGDVGPSPRNTSLASVTVVLSEAIRPSTFDRDDLQLSRDGGPNLIGPGVTVTQLDATTYRVDGLAGLSAAEGTYTLAILAAGLLDPAGNAGVGLAWESWVVDTTAPRPIALSGPEGEVRNTPFDSIDVTLSEPAAPGTIGPVDVVLTLGGGPNLIDEGVTVSLVAGTSATYRISGLARLGGVEGTYRLVVDGLGLADPAGNVGAGSVERSWTVDTTAPRLSGLVAPGPSVRNVPVDSVEFLASEPTVGPAVSTSALTLTRNGGRNLIDGSVTITQVAPTRFRIDGLGPLTRAEGFYTLTILAGPVDAAGNQVESRGVASWLIDTTAPTLDGLPESGLVVRAAVDAGASVGFPAIVASDVFDPNPIVSFDIPGSSTFPLGTTIVNVRARDAAGNERVRSFAVTVLPPDFVAPTVVDAQAVRVARRLDRVVLTFDEALDPGRLGLPGQSFLRLAGRDRRFGTADDVLLGLRPSADRPGTRTLSLIPTRRVAANQRARIEIAGAGPLAMADPAGNLLDGDRDGRPGGTFAQTLAPASSLPGGPARRRAARSGGLRRIDA